MNRRHLIAITAVLALSLPGCAVPLIRHRTAAPAVIPSSFIAPWPTEDETRPASAAGKGGTLMWADGVAADRARAWRSDARICAASVYLASGSDLDILDANVSGDRDLSGGVTVYYAATSSPQKAYVMDVVPVDSKKSTVKENEIFGGETDKSNVNECGRPLKGWKFDSDAAMAKALKIKGKSEFISAIWLVSGDSAGKCPLIGAFDAEHPLVRVHIGTARNGWGREGDRFVYYDGRTGDYLGQYFVHPPGRCAR